MRELSLERMGKAGEQYLSERITESITIEMALALEFPVSKSPYWI